MESAAATLARRWRARGGESIYAPGWQKEVEALERRYGLNLPEDFRLYLVQAAPAEEYWDDGDANWWAVRRVTNIPDEFEGAVSQERIARDAGSYLFFADFLLWSFAWAICCGDGEDRGKVAVITGGGTDRFVAESFTRFVELYVADPNSVA